MTRLTIASALALSAGVVLPAPVATAQTCNSEPAPQHCENRFPPGQYLDQRKPGGAASVSRTAQAANQAQFDRFAPGSDGPRSICSVDVPCAALVGTLQHQPFC